MKTAPRPTGRLVGNDLHIVRTFRAPIEDVWKSVTVSESTARWYGSWTGEPGPGNTIRVTMLFEKDSPASDMVIERCEAPRHLALSSKYEGGEIRVELTLEQSGDTTTMTFTDHLTNPSLAGDMGPGWEYYLDMLVASREGAPLPSFDDYYPAQKQYYLDLLAAQR